MLFVVRNFRLKKIQLFLFSVTKKRNRFTENVAKFGRSAMKNLFGLFRPPGTRHIRSESYSNNNFDWRELARDVSPNQNLPPSPYDIKENNDPPPEIKYNFITRTRQDFPCNDDNKDICEKLIDDGRAVNCSISRFRYISL